MAQISGTDIVLSVGAETTYGEIPGTPVGRKAYVSSFEVVPQQNQIVSPIISGGRGKRRPSQGNIAVAGNAVTTVAPESFGFWLAHAMGTPTTTGAGPYVHTFRPAALPPGIWAAKDYTSKIASKVERFLGLRVASLDLDFPQEGPQTASMSLIGKSYSIVTAPPDATIDDPGHNEFAGFEGIVKRAGSQIGGIIRHTMRIDNEMPGGPYTFPATGDDPGYRFSNPEGRAAISGTLECVFEDFTMVDLATAGTDTTFEVLLSRGDGLGTAGNESIAFTIDHSLIALSSPPLNTASGMLVTFNYSAFASGATDMGIVVVLKNAIAAAAL